MGKSKKSEKQQTRDEAAARGGRQDRPGALAKDKAAKKAKQVKKAITADMASGVGQSAKAKPLNSTAQANGPAGPIPLLPAPVPGPERLSRRAYEDALEPLALALNRLARWLQHTGQRVAVVVEGRDTAGKGGVIGAISDHLSPRQCRVVALPKPDERERSQWYFQRYVPHLPAAGELVLFDRSWYNRAGVEAVMGFCTPAQTAAFLQQAPVFEQLLVDDGILLFKYWLTVDQAEQEARFGERLADPLKRWKLSPIDLKSREKYAEYGQARDAMLRATHCPNTPWTLVDFNDQRRGRLTLIHDLLARIPEVELPETLVPYPPLAKPPQRERFTGPLKPIPPWR